MRADHWPGDIELTSDSPFGPGIEVYPFCNQIFGLGNAVVPNVLARRRKGRV
jgi:hypothetical protein